MLNFSVFTGHKTYSCWILLLILGSVGETLSEVIFCIIITIYNTSKDSKILKQREQWQRVLCRVLYKHSVSEGKILFYGLVRLRSWFMTITENKINILHESKALTGLCKSEEDNLCLCGLHKATKNTFSPTPDPNSPISSAVRLIHCLLSLTSQPIHNKMVISNSGRYHLTTSNNLDQKHWFICL